MKLGQVEKAITALQNELSGILNQNSATSVLQQALSDARSTHALYQQYSRRSGTKHKILSTGWGFSIRKRPLQFEAMTVRQYNFRADLSCEMRWAGETSRNVVTSNLTIRLWAQDRNMYYRPNWDAQRLYGIGERVMLRCHFDLANPDQSSPRNHLQIGGVSSEDEYCWLHEKLDKPRFAHMPMDLVLACELIGATFYEPKYRHIRTSPTWKGVIAESQREILVDYFDRCLRTAKAGDSVLMDYLWQ